MPDMVECGTGATERDQSVEEMKRTAQSCRSCINASNKLLAEISSRCRIQRNPTDEGLPCPGEAAESTDHDESELRYLTEV
jgi:hypothetical protein